MAQKFNVMNFLGNKFVELWIELKTQIVSKYFWKDLIWVLAGAIFYAVGFGFLIYPQGITTGGLTGFCNLFTLALGIGVDVPYNIINAGLLILTFLFLDKNFFIKTLVGIVLIGITIKLVANFSVPHPQDIALGLAHLKILDSQRLLALFIGSIMTGIGLGFVFSVNGCTGGTDVIVALINKYKNISLGRLFLCVDGSIVLMSFVVNVCIVGVSPTDALEKIVFSFIQVVCVSMTLDWYVNSNRQSIQFTIFSSKPEEINRAVTHQLKRGCTKLQARGGYTDAPAQVLVVVVRKQQSVALSRLIEEIDPKAFFSQCVVRGVYGEGFDSIKKSK